MRFPSCSKTFNVERPTRNAQSNRRSLLLFLALFYSAPLSALFGQVGNDNPTGVAGIFSGIVETGCGYSPYTANAIRSVVDVSVPGAVVPLALVRTANSRSAGFPNTFGLAGHWNHNYNWILKDSEKSLVEPFQPTSYTVVFPDGRTETFTHSNTYDSGYFRVLTNGTNGTPAGVQERFQQLDANRVANLILPDGSKVEFKATRRQNGTSWFYSYVAQAIYDPYRLKTTLTYNVDGTLWKVTEPAGRYLEFLYTTVNNTKVIQKVIAHAARGGTRTVQYTYGFRAYSPGTTVYTVLDSVGYFGETTAQYKYLAPNNSNNANGVPLLKICDDPMYSGSMKKIGYTYHPSTPNNPDGSTPTYGQILSENYTDGTTIGLAVSSLEITTVTKRTETRSDGKTHVFNYLSSGYLNDCTDFMQNSASQHYDAYKWIDWVRDRNGYTTNYTCDPVTGNVTDVQFPAAADVTPAPDPRGTLHYTYQSDYYLSTSKDEAGNITTYNRDGNNRISTILYPDNGWESFSYDSAHYYQLQSRRMATGGTENFTYYNDGTHLRETYRNPDTASTQNPTTHYQYDQHDRVSDVTGPLGALGDPNATTSYTYNARGEVATTTFPFDSWNNERHKITNAYNADGTLQSKTDYFNHADHTTNYTYDDYRRLKSVTTPDRGDGTGSHITSYFYDADGNRSSITYPGNAYSFTYTHNSRNQLNGIVGVATYGYDLNGNLISRDLLPRGGSSYTYDVLDRVNHIEHSFYVPQDGPLQPTPTPRPPPAWMPATLDYGYDSVGNRKWTKRGPADGGLCYGDVFGYDLNGQVTGVFLDIEFPETCEAPPVGAPTISYDGAGNRIVFAPYGRQEVYAVNALNQYTTRTETDSPMTSPTPTPRPRPSPHPRPTPRGQQAAAYDYAGNMTTGLDGSTYTYDAQNRLLRATKDGASMIFKYDGLDRQVSRGQGDPMTPTFSVWDGWDLIEEYRSGNNVTARYLYGPSGLIKSLTGGNYYFQDGSGSTSHLTDNQVQVIEWYLYDLQGAPSLFNADGNELSASAFNVRHLFTGQQWYSDIGLYDLRNRFYSPDIGRFLQPDPVEFDGDPTNLYRYCGNNPVTRSDPNGEFPPLLILPVTIILVAALISSDVYHTLHSGDAEFHDEQDNNPKGIPPSQQNRGRRPARWGGGIPPREAEYWTGPGIADAADAVLERVPNEPGSFGLTVMGTGSIPILQGDSYFVSRGGPSILVAPGGVTPSVYGNMGGNLGTLGTVLANLELTHLVKFGPMSRKQWGTMQHFYEPGVKFANAMHPHHPLDMSYEHYLEQARDERRFLLESYWHASMPTGSGQPQGPNSRPMSFQ